jgi:hypothetical protein
MALARQYSPVTPGRRTAVSFDRFLPLVEQPGWSFQRRAGEIARGSATEMQDVVYLPGLGITLRPYHLDPVQVYERETGQTGFVAGTHASGVTGVFLSKTHSYSGVTYSGVAAQGDQVWQKQVASGASWDARLSADQTALPTPDTAADPVALDRVFVSSLPHAPTDMLAFQVHVPGTPHDRYGSVACLYFTGPAGGNRSGTGTGRYALKLHLDGQAVLYERTTAAAWARRFAFQFAPQVAAGTAFYLTVYSDAVLKSSGAYDGRTLSFLVRQAATLRDGAGLGETLVTLFAATASLAIGSSLTPVVYAVPKSVEATTELGPVRIDARRDVRVLYSASAARYPTTGHVTDGEFSVPFHPTATDTGPSTWVRPLVVEWYGSVPSGCTLRPRLYKPDGTELTRQIKLEDGLGGVAWFALPADRTRNYRLKFEFTGPGDKTPVLTEYRVYREAVVSEPSGEVVRVQDDRTGKKLPVLFPASVRASGATKDAEETCMSLEIADLTGSNQDLPLKAGTPVDLEVRSVADGSLLSYVQRGYVARSVTTRTERAGLPGGYSPYLRSGAYRLEIEAYGEYHRLKRRLVSHRLVLDDKEAGLPMKATTAVRILLTQEGGYPDDMVDVPDLPVRLFVDGTGENLLVVEPGTPVVETVREIVEDYLGGYLVFDENAGTRGMWRYLPKRRPPYNNVMKFWREHPGALKAPHMVASYPSETQPNGQVLVGNYVVRGTETFVREPAEGNLVQVFGAGVDGSSSGTLGAALLTQVAVNPVSFDYLGLGSGHEHAPDPTSPDYLGECVPIQVYDPALTTQAAVDFVARRVFDSACFALEFARFQAPLRFVLDVLDPLQVRPRIPRFNDPVLLQQPDGSFRQYLVASCEPRYLKDEFMTADYELVTTTNIDVFGLPTGSFDLWSLTRARVRAAKVAAGLPPRARQTKGRQREFSVAMSPLVAWPAGLPTEIQQLDPSSADFGKFFYMPDYDPVP